MRYGQVEEGRFVERPNRFIAYVDMEEGRQRVHVKNTGRCRELLVPGATVYLERGTAPGPQDGLGPDCRAQRRTAH